ncbi:hypothetical protein [Stenotrophomonas bentonitica]
MDSIPGITAAATPTATSTSTPGAPSAPAKAAALPLETIVQRELAYYGGVHTTLMPCILGAEMDTSEKRFQALGQQLLYITSPCTIGKTPLAAFIAGHPETTERGRLLVANLPAPGDPKFNAALLAYETMLTNAALARDPEDPRISQHAAIFLTRGTDTPPPTP